MSPRSELEQRSPGARRRRYIRVALLAAIVIGLVVAAQFLPVGQWITLLSERVASLGVWGPIAYATIYVVAAILFVPGSALTLAAGALFGLALGTVVVSLASVLAAAIAFLIARHLAGERVRRWVAKRPRYAAIDSAIARGGWKVVALLRLSPVVPFGLSNYLFGITMIRFWPYVLTSWLAMLPATFMYVYLGHAAAVGLTAGDDATVESGRWVLLGVGLAATIVVTLYVTRLARKAMREDASLAGARRETSGGA